MDDETFKKHTQHEVIQLAESQDIEGLINILKSADSATCKEIAAINLGVLKAEIAVDSLLDAAYSNQSKIATKIAAVNALGQIGCPEAIGSLIYLLAKCDYPYLRLAIIEALGALKSESAIKLMGMLINDENEDCEIRKSALEALCKIGTPEAIGKVISVLGGILGDKAASALTELGEVAVKFLVPELKGRSDNKVIQILGDIGSKEAAEPVFGLLKSYITDTAVIEDFCSRPKDLSLIVRSLVKMGDTGILAKTTKMLIAALKPNPLLADKDYAFQCYLIFALGETKDPAVVRPLVNLLLDGEDSRVKYTAAHALATLGSTIDDSEAVQELINILMDKRGDENIKDLIAWALIQTDESKVAMPVLKYLKSKYIEMLKESLLQQSVMA